MVKEFKDALERIKRSHHTAIAVMGCERDYETEKAIDIIEKNFQHIEAIDNSNPSEALECLEDIYRNGVFISGYDALGKQHPVNISPETNKSISEQCNAIKQYILKAQYNEKKLDFLEDAMDLPTYCISVIKNKNNDYVAIMRNEKCSEYEKDKKFRKIVIEKNVDIKYLRDCKTVEEYNKYCDDGIDVDEKPLNKDEFNFLKEMLKD